MDSQYDVLVDMYAQTEVDRLDSCDMLRQFAYETLVDRFENMSEHELIEHIIEMEDDDEIVTSIYGKYPVTDQLLEGRDFHRYSLKEGESISFPVHQK